MCPILAQLAIDMNGDGTFTMKDVVEGLIWLYFFPSSVFLNVLAASDSLAEFLGLARIHCHGVYPSILAITFWGLAGLLFVRAFHQGISDKAVD